MEYTAAEQATNDETIATLEACGFTVTERLGLLSDSVFAVKDLGDTTVNLNYCIQRPNVRLRIKGFGLTAAGRVVHLANPTAIKTFAKSQKLG